MFKSDKMIRDLEVRDARYEQSEECPPIGRLVVRVLPSGTKTFYFRYRPNRKSAYIKIGSASNLSLAAARAKARDISRQVSEGSDPVAENREAKATRSRLGTFDDLLNYYIRDLERRGSSSAYNVERAFSTNIRHRFPSLLGLPANEITSQNVVDIVADYIRRGATTDANRLRSYLMTAFNVAAAAENDPLNAATNSIFFKLGANPVAVVKRQAQFERVGERVIEPNELASFMRLYEQQSSPVMVAMTKALFWAGGPRVKVLRELRFEMIDDREMIIDVPGELTKNGTPQIIPVLPELYEIFVQMGKLHGSDGYVFPSYRSGAARPDTLMSSTSLAQSFSRTFNHCEHFSSRMKRCSLEPRCGTTTLQIPRFVPKDIRRTVKTWMGMAGIEKSIRDRIQHHALSDVSSKHYDRYDYLDEKRAAMNTWGEWLNKGDCFNV